MSDHTKRKQTAIRLATQISDKLNQLVDMEHDACPAVVGVPLMWLEDQQNLFNNMRRYLRAVTPKKLR